MTTLLVGFDSAWTPTNSGAIVGAVLAKDGTSQAIGLPHVVNYCEAEETILEWQNQEKPETTIVLLDQPTIVANRAGQRPVENIVGSAVSLRYGGMQPANTSKEEMFGSHAPIWPFLAQFGGPANPQEPGADTLVFETYPVLSMIAFGWILPDSQRPTGRLPKYNPERRKTFAISDWQHVCDQTIRELEARGIIELVRWLEAAAENPSPRKSDQDGVDACICLLVALHLAELKECLMVGNMYSGYIMAPAEANLYAELQARCLKTGRNPAKWVRSLVLNLNYQL